VRAVADAELQLYGFSDIRDIDSTTLRDRVDPYYLEVHAAFIDINNLFGDVIPRFDLRIGRQTVPWGAADKFNPIANVNTLDLSDPLQFGRMLANNMIRADWNPIGDLTFTAVLIPIFFMPGVIGLLFHEFAVVVGLAILVSAFVSLTLVPMLASRFLTDEAHKKRPGALVRSFVSVSPFHGTKPRVGASS
jgi:hypothetical protein